MSEYDNSLDAMYDRFDEIDQGRTAGDGAGKYNELLDRLAANRRAAEIAGWTACVVDRLGDGDRLRLMGVPPGGGAREVIPDWLTQAD